MNMETKHTPTPFEARSMTSNGYQESAKVIFDNNGNEVCRIDYRLMETGSDGIKKSEENASFIVRACNSHESLVSVLEWALSQIEDDLDLDHQAAFENARAALALARGE